MKYLQVSLENMMIDYKDVINHIARLNYYVDNLMLHADSVHKKEEY